MPHPTLRRTLLLSLLAAATTATVAAPAQAAGPFEPNDSLATATPISVTAGASHEASLETANDVDLYELDLSGLSASVEDLEIEVVNFPASSPRCLHIEALTSTGAPATDGKAQPTPCSSAQSGFVQMLRPANDIVLLKVVGGAGAYRFAVRPGAGSNPPGEYDYGFRARLAGVGADDTQSISVTDPVQNLNEERFGGTTGSTPRTLRLYSFPSAAVLVTFEATSTDRGWSWDWTLTSQNGAPTTKKTVFREYGSGVSMVPIAAGVTRRVTVDGLGHVVASKCADGLIAVPCGNVPKNDYPTYPNYPVVTPNPTPTPPPIPVTGPVATPAGLPKPGTTPPAPKPMPAAVALGTTFKLSGKGKTLKGKVSAKNPVCVAGAKVSFMQQAPKPKKGKKAKKDKTLGSTKAKADGSWTIKLKKAAKGKTYVKVTPAAKNAAACGAGQSKSKTL